MKSMNRFAFAIMLAATGPVAIDRASAQDPKPLTLERIFASGEFQPRGFGGRPLAGSSGWTEFAEAEPPARGRDLVLVDAETGKRSILIPAAHFVPPGASGPLAVEDHAFSADRSKLLIYTNSRRVWRVNSRGDYWVLDRSARVLRKLGAHLPPQSLGHAKFAPDGRSVAYVSGHDLIVEDLTAGTATTVVAGDADRINGSFDWVYEEELFLRDGFRWSPDSKAIAFWQIDTSGVREVALVNNTSDLYPKVVKIRYPKVGETNSACRVGVVEVATKVVRWVGLPGDPRENYTASLEWIPSKEGPRLAMQRLDRRQKRNTLFISEPTTNAPAGSTTEITARAAFVDEDPAWIEVQDQLHWIAGHTQLLWLSERGGWRRIHRVRIDDGTSRPITADGFDVIAIAAVDETADRVWFIASPDDAIRKHLRHAPLNASNSAGTRVDPTEPKGTYDHTISSDGKWSVRRFSAFDTPPRYDLVRLASGEKIRELVDNSALAARLAALPETKTEFFRVEIAPGVELDARRTMPARIDPTKRYPLLVHVYGEPASVNVVDSWGGSNDLWHRMLAARGYVVMSFDNRGTPSPRGRAWRKSVHRRVGILAPADQAAAVRAVLRGPIPLDPDRVGIWGWSGGGSMTLNALFKYPDLYKAGIAIASVPNQRLYDTIYQERYMDLPGDNPDGYFEGSPINFAHRLQGKLLLVHGTGDDNCHYQGAEALVDELIRHDKPFAMMAYPNRSHAINEGANTTIHLRRMMDRFLIEALPPGPR
ncbi:MAG: DPP IV N-terminal domain-containing protein [Isosphaeraceae bacterium]|nr:DPP IV N-terminal domain-containing protein [Isosphaeraceae bacterium]